MPLILLQSRGVDSVGSVASLALSFLLDTTPGSLLVVTALRGTQAGVMTIADDLAHTWTAHANNPMLTMYAAGDGDMWWVVNSKGGPVTVTLTIGATVVAAMCIAEYVGHKPDQQPIGQVGNEADSGVAPITAGDMSVAAPCGIVGALFCNNTTTITHDPGDVELWLGSLGAYSSVDRVDSPTGINTVNWTATPATGYGALAAAFEVAALGERSDTALGLFDTPIPRVA